MATRFVKEQVVRLNVAVPTGPIKKLRMDEDGNFFYLLEWTDADGTVQERWFAENDLIEV
jgi:hypothetical protein